MSDRFKHGNYTIVTDDAAQYREGGERHYVPPAVIVVHEERHQEVEDVRVMIGKSPVDGKMVIHIDGEIDQEQGELARIYLNDTLIAGEEKE